MATTRQFQDMLNDYLPNSLLRDEITKRDYILQKVKKDDGWKGGDIIVPFHGGDANSISFGALTASSDIVQSTKVRGSITSYVEVWGSLAFDHTDLMQHDKLSEQNFVKLLPDEIERFMMNMKEGVSWQLGCGPHFAVATDATDAATGIFIVDKVDRFSLNQLVTLDDGDSPSTNVWVISININTGAVEFSATKGGAAANLSAYSVAQAAKFYFVGANTSSFISMKDAFLSAANGGSATLHGQTKLAYPMLQAVNISGASISATNILDSIFDAYVTVRMKARGNADTILMSLKHWGSIMKLVQIEKGPFSVTGQAKRSQYGWVELEICRSTTGDTLKIAAIQEMDDDVIFFVDWDAMTFRTNGGFRKRKSPDGKEYFEERATTGYRYLVDVCLFGQMEFRKPSHCAVIHSIPAY